MHKNQKSTTSKAVGARNTAQVVAACLLAAACALNNPAWASDEAKDEAKSVDSKSVERIAFDSNRSGIFQIYVVNPEGGTPVQITRGAAPCFDPALSRDRSKIAFSSRRRANSELPSTNLYVASLNSRFETSGERLLGSGEEYSGHPPSAGYVDAAFGPGGSQIAATRFFLTALYSSQSIVVFNTGGGAGRRLPLSKPDVVSQPSYSDNGKLAFAGANRNGKGPNSFDNSDIYVANANGNAPKKITDGKFNCSDPALSPDGSRVAWSCDLNGNQEIFIARLGGSKPKRLTNSLKADTEPCFSPNGKRLAFTSEHSGNREIYVMNIDGSGLHRLTTSHANEGNPSWR